MSTFFKSAAMSLLSKTLQTLLYKYLSDVDVEGVNLPSLYNSDGHSGWGVRLSNVKLREGAKLMDLPGIRCKKKKKGGSRGGGGTSATKRGNKNINGSSNERKSNARIRRHKKRSDQRKKQHERGEKESSSEAGVDEIAGSSSRWKDTEAGQEKQSEDSTVQSKSDVVVAAETPATAQSTTSETVDNAATTTSSSWFSWYKRTTPPPPPYQSMRDDPPPAVPEESERPSDEEEEEGSAQTNIGTLEEETNAYDALLGVRQNDNDAAESEVAEEGISPADEEDSDCDSYNFADEDEEDGNPFVLRLGKGGRIGILDVRLVGKDIHVYVEDADLSIEAVRLASYPSNAKSQDKNSEMDNTGATIDKGKRSSSKQIPEPKTCGERVLAENALARALAALPNLFIRDVRVRFVIRDEVVAHTISEESSALITDGTEAKYGPEDSIVEFSVELLSITDGEDFLANYRTTGDDAEAEMGLSGRDDSKKSFDKGDDDLCGYYDQNEYLVKRVRTGRGPEGGISLRVYPPSRFLGRRNTFEGRPWACHSWESLTQSCVVRCSGLDLQGRVYMGTKNEVGSSEDWLDADYDDEYNVDAMLFGGVDYIAPGPQPPLPPMVNGQPISDVEKFWTHEGATIYQTDANGVQSSAVTSSFHRVARGLTPALCEGDHLPCENCNDCWVALPGTDRAHLLDSSTPMGGLVLSFLTRDPIESKSIKRCVSKSRSINLELMIIHNSSKMIPSQYRPTKS